MERKITITAILLGISAITLGAFGAHGLKKILQPEQLISFETGVRYQMYHALFLLLIANQNLIKTKTKNTIFNLTLVGVLFFSGSIYLLSTSTITGLNLIFLGPITPIGGVFLIASWSYLLYALIVKKNN